MQFKGCFLNLTNAEETSSVVGIYFPLYFYTAMTICKNKGEIYTGISTVSHKKMLLLFQTRKEETTDTGFK